MPTYRCVTLGCKVNQYETEYVCEGLARLGYTEAEEGQPADLCLVNTCTVTAEGDLKGRKVIRQLARENRGAEIVVMGCYAARAAEEVASLPGVTEVVPDKRLLPEFLARLGLVDLPTGISRFGRRHRAYVKVQDGCRLACSYCIVPSVRPGLWSRPPGEVLDEVRRLVDAGYREIVLTGIHLGHYGLEADLESAQERKVGRASQPASDRRPGKAALRDGSSDRLVDVSNRLCLAELTEQVAGLSGEFRIRLSSLEPGEVAPELVRLMASLPARICPHVHVSMQSGSDAVLARMRRGGIRTLIDRCAAVREALDEPALTTDVIVGFPGETEADFAATCRVVEQVGFSKVHVFRFSPREGTPAAAMPGQIDGQIKRRRAAELTALAESLRRRFMERLVGRRLEVLVEEAVPNRLGAWLGTAERYVPVEVTGPGIEVGRLVAVQVVGLDGDRLLGVPLESTL
jgi:threonylcarbamoyladenosine tRNA methylthiotransferase MtaB